MSNNSLKTKHSRLALWCLLLVFIGPFATAQAIYTLRDKFTFKTVETGKLLSPPIQVQSFPFFDSAWLGKWQIVYVLPTKCNAHCQTLILNLNQVHTALGKEKHKVEYHPISANSAKKITVLKPGDVTLIDPRGWLIMSYPSTLNPQGLLKDMHRLLKHSHAM